MRSIRSRAQRQLLPPRQELSGPTTPVQAVRRPQRRRMCSIPLFRASRSVGAESLTGRCLRRVRRRYAPPATRAQIFPRRSRITCRSVPRWSSVLAVLVVVTLRMLLKAQVARFSHRERRRRWTWQWMPRPLAWLPRVTMLSADWALAARVWEMLDCLVLMTLCSRLGARPWAHPRPGRRSGTGVNWKMTARVHHNHRHSNRRNPPGGRCGYE
mmetsp:Transcript_116059/g.281594  ORF Transcript_116059/g.281594 Transcript_116059/m.281594 type:complete len:213 (+) Transcript_116059:74-712(+)